MRHTGQLLAPGYGMLCHCIRNGMHCQHCRRDLADGAPIYRFRAGRRGGATAIRCSDCAAGMTFWNWDPPSPCEGCDRPVSYRRDYRFRHHVTCGQPVCLLAVRVAAARARREPAELHCRMRQARACPQLTASGRRTAVRALRWTGESRLPHSAVNRRRMIRGRFRRGDFFDL